MYHRKQKTQQKNFRSIQIFFTGFIIDDDYPDQDQELDKHHHQDLDLDQDHSDLDPDLYPEIGSAVFRIRFIDDRFAKTKN